MAEPKFKLAGNSITSTIENKNRKEVLINAPACWLEDYEEEISRSLNKRYSERYDLKGNSIEYTLIIQYKIYIPLKTNSKIIVEVRFKAEGELIMNKIPMVVVSAEKVSAAKNALERGINNYWNNQYTLEIIDPICGKKNLDIHYQVIWVETGEHYKLSIADTSLREGVSLKLMSASSTTTEFTFAHEFAHCLGIPDEYSTAEEDRTLRYYKPDGTLDISIDAPVDGKSITDPGATIMSATDCPIRLKRHAWNIAIEAQDVLTKKIGRKIKCNII
ncbi:hypothetical protein AAKU55_003295 [Oxalobacteraceae bacterium GrIS 1.11]